MSCDIECEWMARNELIINPDGQVVPCCFFANNLFVSKQYGFPESYTPTEPYPKEYALVNYPLVSYEVTQDPILKSYIDHKDELNVFNHPLNVVLDHQWFKDLYDSWLDSDKVSPICVRQCSRKKHV